MFVSYSGKDIRIRYQGWQEELDDAFSRDYITEDFDADMDTTKLMRDISDSLGELSQFLYDKEEDEDFIKTFEEAYDSPLSLSNIEFWEEVFNISMSLS